MTLDRARRPLCVGVIAGEASGDRLGGALMAEILRRADREVEFLGVGGDDMTRAGLRSIFPMSEIAVMGIFAILGRLPTLRRRILETVEAMASAKLDVLVIIDCPEFSHRVASRVRKRCPDLPIVDYVAPSVWAWRPGRARNMLRYVDEVMALLPFEPAEFERLGGPRCHYVGHPAIERVVPSDEAIADIRRQVGRNGPLLAVMPGSRMNEITRLTGPFGKAVKILSAEHPDLAVVVPALPGSRATIEAATTGWAVKPYIVTAEEERHAAMAAADAAMVASGTATLELALSGTPMVVGYRMEAAYSFVIVLLPTHSFVLANLIHGTNAVPELFQGACNGERLAAEVGPLLSETPQRSAQITALREIRAQLHSADGAPSAAAADIVLDAASRPREPVAGPAETSAS